MARRPRSRQGWVGNEALLIGAGAVCVALLAYVVAIFLTLDSIRALARGGSTDVGRTVLIRGQVTAAVPVPLTKSGAYAVGDAETSIWVVTAKGLPTVGDRWVVAGTLRAGLDGQGLAKVVSELGSGRPSGSALDAFAQKLAAVRIGAFVEEGRRHQWTFLPWV